MAKNMFDKARDGAAKMIDDTKHKAELEKAKHDAAKKKEDEMNQGDMSDKATMM